MKLTRSQLSRIFPWYNKNFKYTLNLPIQKGDLVLNIQGYSARHEITALLEAYENGHKSVHILTGFEDQ